MWTVIRIEPTQTAFLLLVTVIALVASIPTVVTAQSDRPNRFSGNAYIDGQKAPDGTLVEAISYGKVIGTARVQMRSANINYILDVPRPSGRLELTFRVGGNPAQETATWQDGKVTYPFTLTVFSDSDTGPPLVPPHAFSGLVAIDGDTANSDVEIAAIVEGQTVATTVTSSDGRYKLKVHQGTQNFVGKTVRFTVDGEIASQSALWRQGGVDLLNLTVWSGPRPVADIFASLISDGSLMVVWMYHNDTQTWSLFDPRPEFALMSDLNEVLSGDIVWVEMAEQQSFQGRILYEGWNLITLR